jgi:ribosomal protein S18 acetylase RimI-like enzyme
MINLKTQVRRATAHDHTQLANLLFHESSTHRHLDWHSALEWLGEKNFWVLDEHGFITAALACPEDPLDVAWIRLFSHHPHLTAPDAWSMLWESALAEIFDSNPKAQVSAIVLKKWFQNILSQHHFELKQNIVLLRLRIENTIPQNHLRNIHIRKMNEADIFSVVQIDANAFGSFWQNSFDTTQRAYMQAVHATVAENESGALVGYQISTGNRLGVHLSRLGVRVEAQGHGVATCLVTELIRRLSQNQVVEISVNTQEDNTASMALYQKFGFVKTGEVFPVMVYGTN